MQWHLYTQAIRYKLFILSISTEVIKWMGVNGSYENVVRPITRQVMDWAEAQFGKPASSEHKWVMIGTPLLHLFCRVNGREFYSSLTEVIYRETVLFVLHNLFTVYIFYLFKSHVFHLILRCNLMKWWLWVVHSNSRQSVLVRFYQ